MPNSHMIQSSMTILNADAKVSNLIDTSMRWWKDRLIQVMFSEQKANAINSIPISVRDREDQLIWNYTNNCTLNVESTYHLYNKLQSQKVREFSRGIKEKRELDSNMEIESSKYNETLHL